MNTKKTNRLVGYVAAVFLAWGLVVSQAAAETYSVNASVPYSTPNQAAVIQTPANGASFENALQQVSGTCQLQNPSYSISIVRGGVVLGSTACTDGTFSLAVTLALGQNTLLARTVNVNGAYGPDSSAITLTLKTPTVASPLPTGVLEPTPQNSVAVTNQGALSGLIVTSQGPSGALEDTKTATVKIVVSGGKQPYNIQLQWGDGSTEARSLDVPGTYEFTHKYSAQKTYSVKVFVRDVLGAFAQYSYAIISTKPSGAATTATASKASSSGGQSTTTASSGLWGYHWIWYGLAVTTLVLLLLAYLIGYKRGYRRATKDQAEEPSEEGDKQ